MNKEHGSGTGNVIFGRTLWFPQCGVIFLKLRPSVPHGGIVIHAGFERSLLFKFRCWHECKLGQFIGIDVKRKTTSDHNRDNCRDNIEKFSNHNAFPVRSSLSNRRLEYYCTAFLNRC